MLPNGLVPQCSNQSIGPANQLLGLLIQTLIAKHCSLSTEDIWPSDYGPSGLKNGFDEYDFIIVGAGSSGSVVANRLSENPKWKILLLEAGGDPPIESDIPLLMHSLWNSPHSWRYFTEKSNKFCRGQSTGCLWPRGKVLGGCSSVNVMIYVRGNSRDYDEWEKMGNPTWNWKNVLEYFKKSEDIQIPELVNSKYHGTDGPLKVDKCHSIDPMRDVMVKGGSELGYKLLQDINEEYIGLHGLFGTFHHGKRYSAAKAFLAPIKNRPNFHIVKHAHVTKILFDEHQTVQGIEFILNNTQFVVKQKKDVILSAGALETPHILMLSGIGERAHLESHNIPVISDLPVGQNLQDHVTVPLIWKIKKPSWSNFVQSDAENYYQYLMDGKGFFSPQGLFDISGYFNTINSTDPFPDIQIFCNHLDKNIVETVLIDYGYDQEILQQIIDDSYDMEVIIIYVIILKPKSVGSLSLKNVDPFEQPKIEANYFQQQDDLETIIRGIRLVNTFLNTKTFQDHQIELVRIDFQETVASDTTKYWETYARYFSTTTYHPIGTAKMGSINESTTVVDPRLKVKNVNKFRVIDASIMPNVISGNTNAPAIMIGEKGTDFIKEDWKDQ